MIPVFRPYVNEALALANVEKVIKSGWWGMGPMTAEFERQIAAYLGVKHFVATNSCTSALHLAVRCLDLEPDTLVLTTPITFVSTNMALLYEQLLPIFGVVNNEGNLSAGSVHTAAGSVGAVMVVHYSGQPADMASINHIAKTTGIPVIEDCAHAFGARYEDGRRVGDTDNLCCWSFHAVKNLPMGDGGGVSTNDDQLAGRLRRLRWLGIDKSTRDRTAESGYAPEYDIDEVGYKYHMNDLTAAVGLAALSTIDEDNLRRRVIAEMYVEGLRKYARPSLSRAASSNHFLPLFFDNRQRVAEHLLKNGVATGRHYCPNYRHKPFQHHLQLAGAAEAGDHFYERELTLPLHLHLPLATVERIVKLVKEVA